MERSLQHDVSVTCGTPAYRRVCLQHSKHTATTAHIQWGTSVVLLVQGLDPRCLPTSGLRYVCECVCRGVTCLAHSAAGRGVLLSSGPDGEATRLDTHSGQKLSQFKGSKHGASAAALSEGEWGLSSPGVLVGGGVHRPCAELMSAVGWTTRLSFRPTRPG